MNPYPKPFGSTQYLDICKSCDQPYMKTHPNRLYCDFCTIWMKREQSREQRRLAKLLKEMEDSLDETCKVYDCKHYSQSFLESLIPKK